MSRVAIIGVGATSFRETSQEVSYREMIYDAARRAYDDAQIAHSEIGSFVTASEDLNEGYSIADEYTPDQLGSVLKPMQTIPGDFIHGMATAYMMIEAGLFKTVAVEAHSKASNLKTPGEIQAFALDPIYARPLNVSSHFVAGLEMNKYLALSGNSASQCAQVVVKNCHNAIKNPLAAYGRPLSASDVEASEVVSWPLRRMDVSSRADGCVVMVLAAEDFARSSSRKPVWIRGIGWGSDSPALETREWGRAYYAEMAAKKAYQMADIKKPATEINVIEIDDEYSYKELQHLEALGFCSSGEAGRMVMSGETTPGGILPVNVSGGSLGQGHLLDASGAARTLEVVTQLRGDAGARQIKNASMGLAQSWRGVPTMSGAVVILGIE